MTAVISYSFARWQHNCINNVGEILCQSFVTAFCLDFLITRLQSVQNAAARLIFRILRSEHITPALITLHWPHVPERISSKLAVLMYRSVHGTSPSYLPSCFPHVANMTSRRQLPSSASHRLKVPPVRLYSRQTGVPMQLQAPTCGTTFCSTSHLCSHSRSSDSVSRLSSSLVPTRTS